MQSFAYTAFNAEGRQLKGLVEASDIADARRKLKASNLSVAALEPVAAGSLQPQSTAIRLLSAKFNVTRFFADLSVLMNAGLGIDQALRAMQEAASRSTDKQMISNIMDQISSGATPSNALSRLSGMPEDAIALVASGERSARLAYVVKVVATDLERRDAQRKQMIDAAVYPLFLLAMLFVALGIVTFVLVPTLEPIFESSGRDLPIIVAILSGLRTTLSDPLIVLSVLTGLFAVILVGLVRPTTFRIAFDTIILKSPFLGHAVRSSALGRYLQSLALLLENAVPLPESLNLAARCCPIAAYRERLLSMREIVVSGKRLPEAFTASGLFPRSVVSLVTIGDEVNRLPAVLENAAGILGSEAQRLTDRLLALMTPVITIVLGSIVGGLVISVMTALLGINELSVQ